MRVFNARVDLSWITRMVVTKGWSGIKIKKVLGKEVMTQYFYQFINNKLSMEY